MWQGRKKLDKDKIKSKNEYDEIKEQWKIDELRVMQLHQQFEKDAEDQKQINNGTGSDI